MLTIDGSSGEGGGQVLRTALSLAALLGRPIQIINIRAGRKQPGLRPQHVQAVKAAAMICNAWMEGAREGSCELRFEPQTPPQAGTYRFEIGTAGAATLVLQTVLLPLALAGGPSTVVVRGGTHVAWSPPFDYVHQVYLPALVPLGIRCQVELVTWGFYPKGGGEIRATIEPVAIALAGRRPSQPPPASPALAGLRPSQPPPWAQPRGELTALSVLSAAANVANQVTARQASRAYNRLTAARLAVTPQTQLLNPLSAGPGTCVFLLAEYENGARAGFTGFGRQGYPAERVADDAVDAFLAFHAANAPVDPHLADQLVLPLALLGQPAAFRSSQITQHLLTNIWVVEQFLGPRFRVDGQTVEVGEIQSLKGLGQETGPSNS
ncbi:MAG TPA: RNA 3'-terminal phosphate cyclase [Anaerolineae bacterium]|nr:RNA 3'-terminal phosphate cyclase [Anaerolineae bacterium]